MFIQYMMYTIIKRIKTLHEEMRKNKENLKSKNVDDYEAVYLFFNDKKLIFG